MCRGQCGCQSKSFSSCCGEQSCGCQKSCGCGSCQSKECGSPCSKDGYSAKFLELADHAWMELLKEKIKEHIRSQAKNIDELARLIAEANQERWQKKMDAGQCCECFEEKIKEFFSQACQARKK